MDFFENLPEIAFLRIFDFLPLEDRFRVGRVSQSFRRMSLDVSSRIKSLDLNDPIFRPGKFDMNQFEDILRLCQLNLREIQFRDNYGSSLAKFSEITCPTLIDLNLGANVMPVAAFARIVSNHPNLMSLKWRSAYPGGNGIASMAVEFPAVTLSHLETLHIRDMNDAALERLTDRCPRLKNLEITLVEASSEDILDRFFRSVPRLESLQLELDDFQIRMENLEWFWQLPLTSLTIKYYDDNEFMISDDFVDKLVEHFKNIEYLDLWLTEASDDAVATLARLEKLRVVKLLLTATEFTDVTIRKFSACPYLEELFFYRIFISDQTFLSLFRNCPHLRMLLICGVYDDDNRRAIDAETAGMLLLELSNVPHRPTIAIEIRCGLEMQTVWESIQVQNAVQHMRETCGMEIIIRLIT